MLPLAAAATFFYVARALWPDAALFTSTLSGKRVEWIGCSLKFFCLVLGAIYALRAARRLEADNPSRRAWRGLGLGLGAFAAGQAVLSFYQLGLGRTPPLPSIGDPPFLVGYALMIAATIDFVRVYFASGFPVGSPRALATLAAVGAIGFTALGVPLLRPIATAAAPLAERAINVAYPALDFIALVPALVLVRITVAFRGGGVWRVWAALLLGWIFMAAGDVSFAYLSTAEHPKLVPFVDLTLLLGYLFAALGTMLELELLEAPVAAARAAAAHANDRIA
jgi:hypothetical protein